MIGAGSEFEATALDRGGFVFKSADTDSGAENHIAILPTQHWARGGGGAQNPRPFVGRNLLIGLTAQLIERSENGAEHDFEKRGVLVVNLNVRFNYGEETGEGDLDGINSRRKRGGGETAAVVGEKFEGIRSAEQSGG